MRQKTTPKRFGWQEIDDESSAENRPVEKPFTPVAVARSGFASRKFRRAPPGVKVMKEIRKLQKSVKLLIPRVPFTRLVKRIIDDIRDNFRIQSMAVEALQAAAEQYIVSLFEATNLAAIHAKRITIMNPDIRFVRHLLSFLS